MTYSKPYSPGYRGSNADPNRSKSKSVEKGPAPRRSWGDNYYHRSFLLDFVSIVLVMVVLFSTFGFHRLNTHFISFVDYDCGFIDFNLTHVDSVSGETFYRYTGSMFRYSDFVASLQSFFDFLNVPATALSALFKYQYDNLTDMNYIVVYSNDFNTLDLSLLASIRWTKDSILTAGSLSWTTTVASVYFQRVYFSSDSQLLTTVHYRYSSSAVSQSFSDSYLTLADGNVLRYTTQVSPYVYLRYRAFSSYSEAVAFYDSLQ